MDIKHIIRWAKEYSIELKTLEFFKEFLSKYEKDNFEEYKYIFGEIDKKDLEYQIHTISLNLGNWPECNSNTISASMWVSYRKKQICTYSVYYTFAGVPVNYFYDTLKPRKKIN